MELVKPAFGLIFWMCVSFGLILFILKKFAWKPILNMLSEREESIQNALDAAEKAKTEMRLMKSDNERILNEARAERDALLKDARENIQNEKMAAITELKNQVAVLSIEIAEKILKAELSSDEKQKALVKNLLQDVNLN